MKFKEGDRVVSTALPPDLTEVDHKVGTAGTVDMVYEDGQVEVQFDDDCYWYCYEHELVQEIPLPSVDEALDGLTQLLKEL